MNKKLAMIGAGVVAGSVLLMSSVYAGIGEAPGYNAYKSAIKSTAAIDNVTEKVNLTLEDNGQMLFQVNGTMKSGKDDLTDSAEVTIVSGQTKQSIQFFNQGDRKVFRTSNSDVYRIIEKDSENPGRFTKHRENAEQSDPAFSQEMEKIIDALVGNLKNDVTLKEEGDAKEISLHLKGSQIPAVVNTIGSILIRESGREHGEAPELNAKGTFGVDMQSIKDSLPKLTENIRIENVNLDSDVNADNLITNHSAEIRISGKDIQGTDHEVVLKLSVDSSDFNSTTPDTVDLTGKKVENVQPFEFEGMHKRWNKE